jgi:hypothetical protein
MYFRRHVVPPGIALPLITLPLTEDVVKAALRILSAWTHGCSPTASDVGMIYDARPNLAQLPFDELCCQIIQDYLNAKPVCKAQAA